MMRFSETSEKNEPNSLFEENSLKKAKSAKYIIQTDFKSVSFNIWLEKFEKK